MTYLLIQKEKITLSKFLIICLITFFLTSINSCVSVEKSHCGSTKHSDKHKIKQLKSNRGFKMY